MKNEFIIMELKHELIKRSARFDLLAVVPVGFKFGDPHENVLVQEVEGLRHIVMIEQTSGFVVSRKICEERTENG